MYKSFNKTFVKLREIRNYIPETGKQKVTRHLRKQSNNH